MMKKKSVKKSATKKKASAKKAAPRNKAARKKAAPCTRPLPGRARRKPGPEPVSGSYAWGTLFLDSHKKRAQLLLRPFFTFCDIS